MSDRVPRFAWGHININVSNLDRSIEFYEKLGFEVFIPAIPYLGLTTQAGAAAMPEASARALGLAAETRGRACIMQLGRGFPKIDLTEFADTAQEKPLTNADLGLVRVCLVSQNLQDDYARLRESGVEFLSTPQPGKDGLADIATCVDPDGTLIELLQVYLDKWPSLPLRE
ncbi:MAG: VOC family protein [Gammaproteobacteria bacterium]|nr:VOC family protein [Gammaproteobacteria bacterium]